ncbi:SWI/SNF complex protein [Dacryopinax primogenitus]|uniref:SWI/SNF complex protein n=1 Tax=Dacryopinax primogenitus (strain DJM 731) TaxID=1858805 RepID=M5FUT5_DACPD|nr:SWI/SNF complex protein [Dacryopinax primogenitus]EJT97036.1 SWI/SNF complex protein [Dacryopinax primogenitus]
MDQVGRPSKRRKLGDRNLPAGVDGEEAALYQDLLEMERKLDWVIARKKLDLSDALNKPGKTSRTLRIFLSTQLSNQSWQVAEGDTGPDADFSSISPPAWTMRIEGRLLDPPSRHAARSVKKFTHYLNSLVVELDRDPSFTEGNIIEWHRTAQTLDAEQDGFEIKRMGDSTVKCKIILDIAHSPPRLKVNPDLAAVIGLQEGSLQTIQNMFWNYIRQNGLQEKGDRRKIRPDAALKPLILQTMGQRENFMFHEIPALLKMCLSPADPVVIPYVVRMDSTTVGELKAFDIEIDVDDFAQKMRVREVMAALSPETAQQIQQLDEEISLAVVSVRHSKLKRDFLQSFASDPAHFIERWLSSQARDLKTVMGHESGMRGDLRRSDNFQLPWVEEAVVVHEGIRVSESLAKMMNPTLQAQR